VRALVYDGERLELKTDYPKPRPRDDEVLIKVCKAGICNTDIEIKRGYMGFTGVLGHEFVGIVIDGRDKNIVGKRVVSEINCVCGECDFCLSGLANHCPNRSVLGIHKRDGAFADFVVVPMKNLHLLPEGISDDRAVFIELLAACFNVLQRVHIKPEDNVVVLGDGKLGTLMARVMRLICCDVTLVGLNRSKLERSSSLGIRTCLAGESEIRSPLVVECTGTPEGFEQAKKIVKPRGKIIQKSTFSSHVTIDIASYVVDEVEVIGSRCGPFPPAIRALENNLVKVNDLIDSVYPFDRALEAFTRAEEENSMKVILDMEG